MAGKPSFEEALSKRKLRTRTFRAYLSSATQTPGGGVVPIEIIPAGRLRGEPLWTTTRGAAFSAVSNTSTGGQAIMGVRSMHPALTALSLDKTRSCGVTRGRRC